MIRNYLTNNEKNEKWIETFQRFRYKFTPLDEFIVWNDNLSLDKLNFDTLESSEFAISITLFHRQSLIRSMEDSLSTVNF